MTKLILWDIDGTLLYSGGVAGEAMRAAMTRVYGRSSVADRVAYAGKTDQQIILETFAERSHDDLLHFLETFTATYVAELESRREVMRERAYLLPGVAAALEAVAAHDSAMQSVLTGNVKPAARFKLELLGLLHFFDLEVGAFGSDHFRRPELVPIAVARAAQRYARPFPAGQVVVIGDTPHDIECGRASGARTVGVATGPFSVVELRAHQPDAVLPNLADTEAVLEAIFG